jgi:hypothetical protein
MLFIYWKLRRFNVHLEILRYGRKGLWFEENRPLRKLLASVVVVVWIELLLTTAVASGRPNVVISGSV